MNQTFATNINEQKILLVDDEPHILMALEFLFEQQGFTVKKALDGKQALQKAIDFLPEVIILDVMMPELTGFEVARKLRQMPEFDHTHIIFLTAKGTPNDKMEGLDSGAESYITKPFDNEDLVRRVTELYSFFG